MSPQCLLKSTAGSSRFQTLKGFPLDTRLWSFFLDPGMLKDKSTVSHTHPQLFWPAERQDRISIKGSTPCFSSLYLFCRLWISFTRFTKFIAVLKFPRIKTKHSKWVLPSDKTNNLVTSLISFIQEKIIHELWEYNSSPPVGPFSWILSIVRFLEH